MVRSGLWKNLSAMWSVWEIKDMGNSWGTHQAFSANQHCLPLLGFWFWPGKLYSSPPLPCWHLVNSCSASRSQLSSCPLVISSQLSSSVLSTTWSLPSSVWCFSASVLFYSVLFILPLFILPCLLAYLLPSLPLSFLPSLFPFLSLGYKHEKPGSCLLCPPSPAQRLVRLGNHKILDAWYQSSVR